MKTQIQDRMHRVGETRRLTVIREPGKKKCVLTCRLDSGQVTEMVTTLDPKMMIDYLEAQFPGEIVTWHLRSSRAAKEINWPRATGMMRAIAV